MNYIDAKIFLDTNIIAYIFDSRDVEKKQKAKEIFTKLVTEGNCHISTQVLQELYNVLTKKLKYSNEDARIIVRSLMNLDVYQVKTYDIASAMDINISTQLTIFDSLILVAAKSAGCSIVYSEDLNDGQIVNGIQIVNPLK